MKKMSQYIAIIIFAFCSALNYNIFVFPNSFAPAGIDGICTMIQDLSHIRIGYLALFVNIPLLIASYFSLNHEYTFKTSVYVLAFSLSDIFLQRIGIANFAYYTVSGTSIVLAPIAAGVIRGILYALTLNLNGSSGGVDIIAALVKKKMMYFNLMNTIFVLNLFVAVASYFVYGFKIEPVICSIIYSFTTSTVSNNIRSSRGETIKFEIITSEAEKLCKRISNETGMGATIISVKGGYTGENRNMVVCVTKKNGVPRLKEILKEFTDTVVFKSVTNDSLADI